MIKKRVAVYRSDLLPISETFIRDQVSALIEWEPVLVGRRELKDGLKTPNLQRCVVQESGNRWIRTIRYWLWRPEPCLVRHLRKLGVNLVHAHFGTDATDIWPSIKAAGLPLLVTLHGYDINTYHWWWKRGHGGLRRRVYPHRLLKMAQDSSVRFIAVSNAIKQRAIEYGIPPEKITVCYVGVDTERFKPGGLPLALRPKRILFIGRMVENKAPLQMIRTYAEVCKSVPDAELVMIGEGPLLAKAKNLANELGISIDFLGARDSDTVLEHLNEARVLCLPSITLSNGASEAFGLVLLEAQACGIPVISSAKGGAYEGLLDGETGYRFAEGKIDECTKHILSILTSEENLYQKSNKARSFVEKNFDTNHLIKNLERVYSIHFENSHGK